MSEVVRGHDRVDSRVSLLNGWLNGVLIDGALVHYDRKNVASSSHTQVQYRDGGVTVSVPHTDVLRKQYEADTSKTPVGGTCRELAQWAVVNLKREGLVDSAEVYACATDTEAHYVVIATIGERKYLIDIAYSQPVLQAIPVDGNEIISNAYAGAKGSKQAFSGQIKYKATEDQNGGIMFTIEAENRSTQFPLAPLTDELDKQIPKKWIGMTGSVYGTVVRANDDFETYRVDALRGSEEAQLKWDFGVVHQMVSKLGQQVIEVVLRR